jgi:hypothetical protein
MLIWNSLPPVATEPTPEEWDRARAEDRVVENLSGDEEIEGWKSEGMAEGGRILIGIVILIVIAAYGAILFIAHILPSFVHRVTHEFYGSGAEAETDPMHDARSMFAQGDFEGAIEAYRSVAAEQPENRFPWVEIAKIQHDNLEDCDAAIETLRMALESHEWRVNDAAFFMFRLAEIYEVDKLDLTTAVGILQQVVDMFPETRHAANATHRLRELGAL